jgi:hypothetical protein
MWLEALTVEKSTLDCESSTVKPLEPLDTLTDSKPIDVAKRLKGIVSTRIETQSGLPLGEISLGLDSC